MNSDRAWNSVSMRGVGFLPFLLIFVVLAGLFRTGAVSAATYYVSVSGNDASAGTISAPFRTIGRGVGVAAAGDTVYLRGGTYVEQMLVHKSGYAGMPIRIQAYPGESPIIDGQNRLPGSWDALVFVGGNYVEITGLEVANSTRYGVHLQGHHNAVRSMNIHHALHHGLLLRGDYSVAEDNRVWQTALSNNQGGGGGMWGAGLSATRDPVNGITDNAIIRRNIVYNNWGEGISSFEANGTIIEDNIIYDNWAANLYFCDTTNAIAQRNLVYGTAGNPIGRRACGICMADETAKNFSSNITIVNNLVHGTITNFTWWSGYPGTYMNNVLIAHNTLVNVVGSINHVNVAVDYGAHRNVRFMNNIIQQDDALSVAWINSANTGLIFSNNVWSKKPAANASSPTDVVANPQLAKTGLTGAGQFNPDWFRLSSSSPARDKAAVISSVIDDYFDGARDATPDAGAHEFGGSAVAPPPAPAPTPTPTPTTGNLALNKTAVASSTAGGAYVAIEAVDGDPSSSWSSASVNAAWIYVDLGQTYSVNRVKLAWGANYSTGYAVAVSNDLTNWTTFWSTTTGTGGTVDLTGLSAAGRYVRVNSWARATANGTALAELEVYGPAPAPSATNLALNKPASSSTAENANYPASKAFDGSTATRWSSQFSDPQWLQVDLGAAYNISRIKLVWEAAYSASYKLQVSNDGGTWTDIYSTSAGRGGTEDLTSVTGVGRYLRVYGLSRGTGWGHSLWEVEVYGTPKQ